MKKPKRSTKVPFEIDPMPLEIQGYFGLVFNILRPHLTFFSESLTNALLSRCEVFKFKKNDILLDYGEICRYCYFAVEGLVLIKFMKDGIENVKWALIENDVFTSVKSFNHQVPSMDKLIARENTIVVAISWENLEAIYAEFIEFERVGRKLTQHYYEQTEERATWVHYDAEERFAMLLKDYPWVNRVTDSELASHLGITKEYFSRNIKNKYRKK